MLPRYRPFVRRTSPANHLFQPRFSHLLPHSTVADMLIPGLIVRATRCPVQLPTCRQGCALVLACMIAFPGPTLEAAETLPRQTHLARDVTLHPGGVLRGRVVWRSGAAASHVPVTVHREGRSVESLVTQDDGQFWIEGLSGGVMTIRSGATTTCYRIWTVGTAPPTADTEACLVRDEVVRGQFGSVEDRLTQPGALSAIGLGLGGVASTVLLTMNMNSDDAS